MTSHKKPFIIGHSIISTNIEESTYIKQARGEGRQVSKPMDYIYSTQTE